MVFERFFGRGQTTRFECLYRDCGSLCCKNNLVVLNEDDIASFKEMGIPVSEVTETLGLNEFLKVLGATPMKQLEGLQVLRLKKTVDEGCAFLIPEDGACRIYDRRPYYCREFPFKFSKGKIKSADPVCPGLNRGAEKDLTGLKKGLGLEHVELKPPFLLGDSAKLKTARPLMSVVFRLLR